MPAHPPAPTSVGQDGGGAAGVAAQEARGVVHAPVPHKPAGLAPCVAPDLRAGTNNAGVGASKRDGACGPRPGTRLRRRSCTLGQACPTGRPRRTSSQPISRSWSQPLPRAAAARSSSACSPPSAAGARAWEDAKGEAAENAKLLKGRATGSGDLQPLQAALAVEPGRPLGAAARAGAPGPPPAAPAWRSSHIQPPGSRPLATGCRKRSCWPPAGGRGAGRWLLRGQERPPGTACRALGRWWLRGPGAGGAHRLAPAPCGPSRRSGCSASCPAGSMWGCQGASGVGGRGAAERRRRLKRGWRDRRAAGS